MKRALQAISNTLLSWGPFGILLLAVLDSAGIPAVEGVDLLVISVASRNPSVGYLSAGLAVIGSVVGSLFLFYVGRKGGEEYLGPRTQKGWAKRFRRWFHHYGGLTVFIPALMPIPLPLKIFVLSAGALGMRRSHFILIVLGARAARYGGLAWLGSQMGERPWHYIKSHLVELLAVSVALFLLLFLMVKLKDRVRRLAEEHAGSSGHG